MGEPHNIPELVCLVILIGINERMIHRIAGIVTINIAVIPHCHHLGNHVPVSEFFYHPIAFRKHIVNSRHSIDGDSHISTVVADSEGLDVDEIRRILLIRTVDYSDLANLPEYYGRIVGHVCGSDYDTSIS